MLTYVNFYFSQTVLSTLAPKEEKEEEEKFDPIIVAIAVAASVCFVGLVVGVVVALLVCFKKNKAKVDPEREK